MTLKTEIRNYVVSNPNCYGRYIFNVFPQLSDEIKNYEGRTDPEKIFNYLNNTKLVLCGCGEPVKWYGFTRGYSQTCSNGCNQLVKRNLNAADYKSRLSLLGYIVHTDLTTIEGNKQKVSVTNTECDHTYMAQLANILNQKSVCGICGPQKRTAKLRALNIFGLTLEAKVKRKLTFDQKRETKLQRITEQNLQLENMLLLDQTGLIDFLVDLKIKMHSKVKTYLESRYPKILKRIEFQYGNNFGQKLYHLINKIVDIESAPKCPQCGKTPQYFINSQKYHVFCSVACKKVSPLVTDKSRDTQFNRYGGWHLSTKETDEKKRATCLAKYGVEHPLQNLEIIRKVWKAQYRNKTVILPSGKAVELQGYEPQVIVWLLKNGKHENDFEFKIIPSFMYKHHDKNKIYHPDFYIPKENLIIEVKSAWTLKNSLMVTNLKKRAVLAAGYMYKLIVWDDALLRPLTGVEINNVK